MLRNPSSIERFLLVCTAAVLLLCGNNDAAGQERPSVSVEGYVTALRTPTGFEVSGTTITTSPATGFALTGNGAPLPQSPWRGELRVGAYVQVFGVREEGEKSITAQEVFFRDEWSKKISGEGLVVMVLSAAAEPVFLADGYRIRIPAGAELTFTGSVKTLAEVKPNTWLRYEGKRDTGGALVASKAEFIPAKPLKISGKPLPQQEPVPLQGAILAADGSLLRPNHKVRMNEGDPWCGWHRLCGDAALQERVQRVGRRVLPAFQKQLEGDSLDRIPFRFYAVDEAKVRSDLFCQEGLVVVPKQVVERLANDDQLAALLADGVAFNLQRRSPKLIAESYELLGAELAGDAAGAFSLPANLANVLGSEIFMHKLALQMQEQRDRIALALLADAGYDPHQAPEAWRRLEPKTLPKDLNSLKYPKRSGYQLGILNLQYRTAPAPGNPPANAAPSGER